MEYDEKERITRAAAQALAPEMPEGFEASVEAELASGGTDGGPKTYLDPATAISLASLLVSAASLAWTIYRDLKKDAEAKPAPQVISRKVRMQLRDQGFEGGQQFDRIVEVVTEEVVKVEPA